MDKKAKNRLAANRFRAKQKSRQEQMVQQADFLTIENDTLQFTVRELIDQVHTLRELLLAHDTCQCSGIKAFLQKTSASL